MRQLFGRLRLEAVMSELAPRMAGVSLRERLVAVLGALLGVGITGLICGVAAGSDAGLPLLVAPIGASAVLLFAVPASPLAQPWSIIGGNTISTLVAVAVNNAVPQPIIAAAVAVAAAIAVMSLLRCLHPPGGATALLVTLLGPQGPAGNFLFALIPVGLNSLVLVLLGYGFHRLSGHGYPHLPKPAPVSPHGTSDPPPQVRRGLAMTDIDLAITESGKVFDIGRDDLARLIRRAEQAALERTQHVPQCADVMSKDVITVTPDATLAEARSLLLERGLRTLPVIGIDGTVAGVVGLRNLDGQAHRVAEVMLAATTARPGDSVLALVEQLTDGRSHAAVIVDEAMRLQGLITQTDLIAVLAQLAVSGAAGNGK